MVKLIVIDGLDGSGKETQFKKLTKYLKDQGNNVATIDFPDYDSESSALVKMYLSGKFGTKPLEINPYAAASFYAVDRFAQYIMDFKKYFEDTENDYYLLANRYISANIIHQGSKLLALHDQVKYFDWVYDYETKLLGLPKEDITILLSVPVEISQDLLLKRYKQDKNKRDIHESDIEYMHRCYNTTNVACLYLKEKGYNWIKINCAPNNKLLSQEEVFNLILTSLRQNKLIE